MNVSLVDVDGHIFPNFALMKLSAWHKANGDAVEWYAPLFSYPDMVYASKVFTFTKDYSFYPSRCEVVKGGTGYNITSRLPDEVDAMLPDYSIYPMFDYAIGFLSRGCIRNCPWCVVPRKEGIIRRYDDIERVAQGRKKVVLMDNNFLANDFEFIKEQLEKSVKLGVKIDFNQGLDARLVTDEIASLLAKCKWICFIRFACDTMAAFNDISKAVKLVRQYGFKKEIFVYVLAKEVDDAHERIVKLLQLDKKIVPFCQPFRNFEANEEPKTELKHLARWCNRVPIRKSCSWNEYAYHNKNTFAESER